MACPVMLTRPTDKNFRRRIGDPDRADFESIFDRGEYFWQPGPDMTRPPD